MRRLSQIGATFEARDVIENSEWLDELTELGGR